MSGDSDSLRDTVHELGRRPGHEKVRALVWSLLTQHLGVDSRDVTFEKFEKSPEVVGRIDALLGRTVFEFKRDLRSELDAAESQLAGYMKSREAHTGYGYVGIATDGATFIAYDLAGGRLRELKRLSTKRDRPRELLEWLESAVAWRADLEPEPELIQRDLGRESIAYGKARRLLEEQWQLVRESSESQTKRRWWAQQLEMVYGGTVESDALWFQHTYLTIVAKTMATAVLNIVPPGARDLLDGAAFEQAGVLGAVEADFFNWVLDAPKGEAIVNLIAREVGRFRLANVRTDVLKGLYESLIDPATRHDLGEYYTPDWLAARVCARAITDPLTQRVLDPACGSGTFLFHAVRMFRMAASTAGWDDARTLEACCSHVFGIDVHPVAAIIARVTYLLALGDLLSRPHGIVSIPVYLGDTLQWNRQAFFAEGDLLVQAEGELLQFPSVLVKEPTTMDHVVNEMLRQGEGGAEPGAFGAWVEREFAPSATDRDTLEKTYAALKRFHDTGRDHIWGYVIRNLSRPTWLSSTGQRADVIVGNPPWLSYRYMSRAMQERFKAECMSRGLWAGGRVATHQDLSGYFFVTCVERYLRAGGLIAFVMPYAAMNRAQFAGFRTGQWRARRRGEYALVAQARFVEAWTFDEDVQPLFPVPSCVLIAQEGAPSRLPAAVRAFRGRLPRRDAHEDEAAAALTESPEPWPEAPEFTGGSQYREAFRQGATLVPRMLCIVERAAPGPLGGNLQAPLVRSRKNPQEKEPWRSLPGLSHAVEAEFLRPVYLGESIGPFRVFEPELAVIPWDGSSLLDAASAQRAGYPRLATWLAEAERLWASNGGNPPNLVQGRWDYHHELAAQFPIPALRVLFAASGTVPAVAVLPDESGVIEHGLYWAFAQSRTEARYLAAVLSSEVARARVGRRQARGQWGARHFDKLMFSLPIPRFAASDSLHRDLAAAAEHAETVAAAVDVSGVHFVTARRRIREALQDDGIAQQIEALVARLLP